MADEEICPHDDGQEQGHALASGGTILGQRLPPEGPVRRQHDESDRRNVLLHLEHADGLEKSKLFQREAGSETVLRVYPCSHDEGGEVENDDRRHIRRAWYGAEAR